MALILVKHGPEHKEDQVKLECATEEDVVVLIQDGIYWVVQGEPVPTKGSVYVLKEDLVARGYGEHIAPRCVDYGGLVDLIFQQENIIS